MLELVERSAEKRETQRLLESNLKKVLKNQGVKNIGYPGGNADHELRSNGAGGLWFAPSGPRKDNPVPRFWNSFGVYDPGATAQNIVFEANIPAGKNTGWVAGFFARDAETGEAFLMHSGKVGGGGKGVGKTAFLAWASPSLVDVSVGPNRYRSAIVVGNVRDPRLSDRIWKLVQRVAEFKRLAKAGELDTPVFRGRIAAYSRYSREFSGRKTGRRRADIDYVTFHGDVVDKLYVERLGMLRRDEEIVKTNLIDLGVRRGGDLIELYEVKMSCGRQDLYCALGQIVTHSAGEPGVSRFLVVPAGEVLPPDVDRAIHELGITVRTFRLSGSGRRRAVTLQ